jgi:hypothetical protein
LPRQEKARSRATEEIAARAVHIVAALVRESKPMSESDLAQQIIERVCHQSVLGELAPEFVALCIVGSVPALQGASQEQFQAIFDSLVGACTARQLAGITSRLARYIA